MYSVDEIKEILAAFDKSKATKIDIKNTDGQQLLITQKKECAVVSALPVQNAEAAVPLAAVNEVKSPFVQTEETKHVNDGSTAITSPMVGVFYAAPSPDKDPYVTVGARVKKGDVICLIEAMKLMNEVTAEKDGEITEICVDNGQVVEYGQDLFMIK